MKISKRQLKVLRTTVLVLALLLLPATYSYLQQRAAARKPVAGPVAPAIEAGYDRLTFELLKSWTYVEGKSTFPGFITALDGKPVEMLGYMMPLTEIANIKEFLLVPSLWGCCYGQPPAVNHIVAVKMPAGQTTKFCSGPIRIDGQFHVGETKQDGYVVSLYVLTPHKIVEIKNLD